MQTGEQISAYDLAREIVEELERQDVFYVSGDLAGFAEAEMDQRLAQGVIESMLRQAINRGGIKA